MERFVAVLPQSLDNWHHRLADPRVLRSEYQRPAEPYGDPGSPQKRQWRQVVRARLLTLLGALRAFYDQQDADGALGVEMLRLFVSQSYDLAIDGAPDRIACRKIANEYAGLMHADKREL